MALGAASHVLRIKLLPAAIVCNTIGTRKWRETQDEERWGGTRAEGRGGGVGVFDCQWRRKKKDLDFNTHLDIYVKNIYLVGYQRKKIITRRIS
jgi:hypothetical protein